MPSKKNIKSVGHYVIPALEKGQQSLFPQLKKSLKQIAKTGVYSLLLFSVGFLTLNAQAYSGLFMAWVNQDLDQDKPLEQFVEEADIAKTQKIFITDRLTIETTVKGLMELDLAVAPPDDRLIIPKLDKNVPIISSDPTKLVGADWNALEKTIQENLQEGVVRYPGTAEPGTLGNAFLTGHSSYYLWDEGRYKDVFARLTKLEIGDDIIVYYDQQKHHYVVTEKKRVKNSDISILDQNTNKKQLTLMTCGPVGANFWRDVVIAELVEE